jgi:hypothetical protein
MSPAVRHTLGGDLSDFPRLTSGSRFPIINP